MSAGVERFSKIARSYDDRVSPSLAACVACLRAQPWFIFSGVRGHQSGEYHQRPRALELGCGTGQLSFELLDSLAHVTGCDPAAGMIEVMQAKIEAGNLEHRMATVCADLLDGGRLPAGLELGGYDLIFSKLAFHHITDCGAMVKALKPFLAPGGRLVICDLEATANARQFHLREPEMTKGVEYEHDGLSESVVRDWFRAAGGFAGMDVARTTFEQPTHACWAEIEQGTTSQFGLILASACAVRPSAKL
jgi:SAM-dependent methyltransferase